MKGVKKVSSPSHITPAVEDNPVVRLRKMLAPHFPQASKLEVTLCAADHCHVEIDGMFGTHTPWGIEFTVYHYRLFASPYMDSIFDGMLAEMRESALLHADPAGTA